MKTLQQINSSLSNFGQKYGISTAGGQGSEAWLKMKLGVLSASNASKIVAKKDSETRLTYMSELVAQVCTGEQEELNSKYLEWGKAYEDAARSSYEFSEGVLIEQVAFVFNDDNYREGCSPDGLLVDQKKGIELKCPYNPTNYVKFLCSDKTKKEYDWQMQFQMRILGCDFYDMVQYHPNMRKKPLHAVTFEKNLEAQKTLEDAVPQFIKDMDAMLMKVGVEFGDQWGAK